LGKELPEGHGTAKEGAPLYLQKGCAGCHGRIGSGAPAPTLIRSDGTTRNPYPCLSPCVNDNNVMALHSPYATVLWDYINRGMPLGKEETLKPDEVYSLSAFLLYKNGVIKEDDVMDAQSLPKVVMPNRNGFSLPPEEWKHGTPRLKDYP
jgi:cytochrome c